MSLEELPLEVRRQRLDSLLQSLQLVREPFPVTPDHESYFFSPRLQIRYEELQSAVALRKGFVLVTGDVGVGKTTLARLLMKSMQGQGVRTALVINTFVQGTELLRVINRDFGLEGEAETIEGLLDELHAFLLEQYAEGANCVLLIDDAQALSVASLELLRQLSNLETSRHKLLQLVLVGQPELLDLLGRADLRQLRSRIAMHLRLEPMTLEEMDAYIYHRLSSAGNGAALKVAPDALRMLWERTSGYPRRVHLVMDRCLFGALARRVTRIDQRLMREAIAEVEIPGGSDRVRPEPAPVSRPGRSLSWPAGAAISLFAVAGIVAAVRLEAVPLPPSAIALLETGQTYVERARGALISSTGAEPTTPDPAESSPPSALLPEALAEPRPASATDTGAQASAENERPDTSAAASESPRSGTRAAPGADAILSQVPEPLWQSFWRRIVAGNARLSMPSAASLPPEQGAALELLDTHLEGTGLRSLLLDGSVAPCDEDVALRIASSGAVPDTLFVLASVPPSAGQIEFGRYSETVRWAQERLRLHGLLRQEHVDALLGPVTVAAIAHFQREQGLPATGLLDDRSLYRLSCMSGRDVRRQFQGAEATQ